MGQNRSGTEDPILENPRQLLGPFEAAFANRGARVGIESEKFGVRGDGTPLRYGDEHGVAALLDELATRFGWTKQSESEGAPTIALVRGDESITLEPGSQLELSGSPFDDVHSIVREIDRHRAELAALDSGRDLNWLGLGFHPIAHQHDLDWVPKSRYRIMRDYLPTRGAMGVDMMRRTATVQANFDFSNERDAVRKLQVALGVAPVVQALFANSAIYENVRHPIKSHRAEVWLDVDPDRSGLLPFMWQKGASLEAYVNWALDVPMFIVKRGKNVVRATDQTFRAFLANGRDGIRATMTDWETHLNTLFPEVRIKRTLEVRSADSVPGVWSAALPAIWTGILYDAQALDAAADLVLPFGFDAWNAVRPHIAREGLQARVGGRELRELAVAVLDISAQGLARRAPKNDIGEDERIYLAPVIEAASRGESVGDVLLGNWSPSEPNALPRLLERARF